MVGEPTLPGCWTPPAHRGTASGSRQDCEEAMWLLHPKHLKEMAPQELPAHQPLAQVTLSFSATEDGTTLLGVRPAQGTRVVGEGVQSPP